MVNETVLFRSQIKTKQRYVWTKRELTEEGRALGELVDQVSLPTVQMSGIQLCVCIIVFSGDVVYLTFKTFSSVCGIFLLVTYSFPSVPRISPLGSLKFNFSLPVLSDDRLPMNWAWWWISTMCLYCAHWQRRKGAADSCSACKCFTSSNQPSCSVIFHQIICSIIRKTLRHNTSLLVLLWVVGADINSQPSDSTLLDKRNQFQSSCWAPAEH